MDLFFRLHFFIRWLTAPADSHLRTHIRSSSLSSFSLYPDSHTLPSLSLFPFFSLSLLLSFFLSLQVEHDLSVLDYLSDYICCLWGKPGAYGVVTMPFSVREGINIFLDGFVPTENLRFRDESLNFKLSADQDILPEDIQVSCSTQQDSRN